MTTTGEGLPEPLPLHEPFAAFARAVTVAVISGAAAGVIAGGVGSRVAMRIVAITASDADQGAITDAEETVGEITAEGTIFLVFIGGGGVTPPPPPSPSRPA